VTIWNELKAELLRLQNEHPDALLSYPNPTGTDDRPPPYQVTLEASQELVAESLYRRFGHQIHLRLGALPYPLGPDAPGYAPNRDDASESPPLPAGLTVALSGRLSVRSGETARHGLLVSNATGSPLVIDTNGQLIARIVDPATGRQVGGFAGAMRMPLVRFPVADACTKEIPLLVGTASYVPELGYTIPPGSWSLTAELKFAGGTRVRTPPLAFEVTK
jgi:hypothetical protein